MSTSASAMVNELASISLPDLDAIAALQVRNDRKYVVDEATVDLMIGDLAADLKVLEIDGLRTFDYRSVYFDTPDFDLHHAAATGRRRRFKVRTRVYEDSGQAMLEVKTKDGRGRTVKERLDYDIDDSSQLTPEGRRFLQMALVSSDVPVADDVLSHTGLQPVLTTAYRRSTIVHETSGTRATIDCALVCTAPDGRSVSLDAIIVESKSLTAAGPVDRWMWANGHRPVKISKCSTGLAALNPELPSNKWRRILDRHFS
ncbi:polyphosphate polymerase domain-containing protein [Ilumatobacter sp.]|uniref:polyphosphate polymerase domain-containing protein n=1 Tax=Ilumatobacter sp. TaxID=1967498 RepID=UPI003750532E